MNGKDKARDGNMNMFDPRFGKRPMRFVGREDVLRDIRAALSDPDETERIMVLSGVRGSGKSSILAEIRAEFAHSDVVFISYASENGLFGDAFADAGAGVAPAGANAADAAAGAAVARDPAAGNAGAASGSETTAVYMVDDANPDMPGLRSFLASFELCVRRGENVRLILAGLPHMIDELLKDGDLSFLRGSKRAALGSLREDEVQELYMEAFKIDDAEVSEGRSAESPKAETAFPGGAATGPGQGMDSAKGVLLRAAEATAGYPYMVQLVGYYLSKEKEISDKAANKAIFLAKIELYKNVHDPLVWSLSSKDRMFLWAMAQDEGHSEFGEIARRMDVSAGYASKYRERLINAGVIYRSAYGELAFTLPFMKEYVEKEYIERLGGEGGKRRL